MAKPQEASVVQHLGTLFGVGTTRACSDRDLLERFSRGNGETAEAAFATLVERHGPMVLRVCRGVVGDTPDAHDAFQATFLVLIRKARGLWVRESLAPWLHGVALRVARKARIAASRRQRHERLAAETIAMKLTDASDDGSSTVHEEVDRLPRKYRAPIVLCYLEGLSHDDAALALGWPVGTVRGRLARARDLLRTRLRRRGLAPSPLVPLALFSDTCVTAPPVPESLIRATMALVPKATASAIPSAVAELAEAFLNAMVMSRLKTTAVAVVVVVAGAGLLAAAQSARSVPAKKEKPPAARAEVVAAQPVEVPEYWEPGATVTGRVVDQNGNPVVGADVLLLGGERLTVHAEPEPDGDGVRLMPSLRPPGNSSAKTDENGAFTVHREGSSTDRIAIVWDRMMFWEVTRKQLPRADNLLVALPKPCPLTIHADIPGKPAKQDFWVVGRVGDRLDWESDCLYYRHISVPNPGKRTIAALPPGQYAIERFEHTSTDVLGQLMTPCERRLVTTATGKPVDVTYDRKAGRPVEGRVRGLENTKLRRALITISYWGPEEVFKPDDEKKHRLLTNFDVIPIGPDGRFTTPPLPPNRYEIRLSAMKASTAPEANQSYDFGGFASVVVPESGAIAPVEIVAKRRADSPSTGEPSAIDPKEARLEVRAHDETGVPINDFTILLYGAQGRIASVGSENGLVVMSSGALNRAGWTSGELIVSAPDFAPTSQELDAITSLRKIDVGLKRGKRIRLRVRDPEGNPLAKGLSGLVHVYAERHREEARRLLAIRDLENRARQFRAANLLDVRDLGGGEFEFRVRTDEPEALYVGFGHPDVLLSYENGPVNPATLPQGVWDITLPRPATVDIVLKPLNDQSGKAIFADAHWSLMPDLGPGRPTPVLASGSFGPPAWRATIPHLSGSLRLQVSTTPANGGVRRNGIDANPGIYSFGRQWDAKPGEHLSLSLEPQPLRMDRWRGNRSARVIIQGAGNRGLSGEEFHVFSHDAHYGRLPVASGKLADDGRIVLENLAPTGADEYDGVYSVEVGAVRAGTFRVKDEPGVQEFRLNLAPREREFASEGAARDLATGKLIRIADFRGRVVFLEFWATWCGPCQAPIERLAALAKRRSAEWLNDVALVAVSIDNDRGALRKEVRARGLESIQHLWSPENKSDSAADAQSVYSVSAVPTAFLIDRDGRIVWRGQPGTDFDIEKRIEESVKPAR